MVFDQDSYEKDALAPDAKFIWSWRNFLFLRMSSMVTSVLALPKRVASWRMISSRFPWLRGFMRKKMIMYDRKGVISSFFMKLCFPETSPTPMGFWA